MCRFAKTTDGRKWVVVSDNEEEETMDLVNLNHCDEHGRYDKRKTITENFSYHEIIVTDINVVCCNF